MKHIILVLATLLVFNVLPSCKSEGGARAGVDWPRASAELVLLADDINDFADAIEDEDRSAELRQLVAIARDTADVIAEHGNAFGTLSTLETLLDATSLYASRSENPDLRLAVVAVRVLVRRALAGGE
jgi:hypothetical protein